MTPRSFVPRPADDDTKKQPVVFLGGVLQPVDDSFRPLRRLVSGQVRLAAKDLEAVTRGPAAGYSLDTEVEALMAFAEEQDWHRFNLVAEGEGAGVALVAALKYPDRVLSLGLDELIWAGNREPSTEESELWQRVTNALRLEDRPMIEEYCALQIRKQAMPNEAEADLQPPPDTAPPRVSAEFAAARPAALRAIWQAFEQTDLDYAGLVKLQPECYLAFGGDGHPAYEAIAHRLHGLMPYVNLELYEGRSPLDRAHFTDAERFALALAETWRKAQRDAVGAGARKAPETHHQPHFG